MIMKNGNMTNFTEQFPWIIIYSVVLGRGLINWLMNLVTKRATKDCPLHTVKSIKALNLKDFRKQVNYYVYCRCITSQSMNIQIGTLMIAYNTFPHYEQMQWDLHVTKRNRESIRITSWKIFALKNVINKHTRVCYTENLNPCKTNRNVEEKIHFQINRKEIFLYFEY